MTDEKRDEHLLRPIVRAMLTPGQRAPMLRRCAKVLGVAFGVGLVGSAVTAVGHCIVLGPGHAWMLYGRAWLGFPLVTLALPVAFVVGIGLAQWALEGAFMAVFFVWALLLLPFSEATGERITKALGQLVKLAFVGMVVFAIFDKARESATQSAAPPARLDDSTKAEVRKTVQEQAQAVERLSASATELLARLDETAREAAASREDLQRVLSRLDAERSSVDQSRREVEALFERETLLRVKKEQLRAILDGRELPDRGYFDSSGRDQYVFGIVTMLIGAVIGIAMQEALNRVRGRRAERGPPTAETSSREIAAPTEKTTNGGAE